MEQFTCKLPIWNARDPLVVAAWSDAMQEFAQKARGNVRVLQGVDLRINSMWAKVQYPTLIANPNVYSITSINPDTGIEVLLWSH